MNQNPHTHTVPPHFSDKVRLSDYLVGIFSTLPSRKSVKKAIINQEIWVDGKIGKTGDWVKNSQKIEHRSPFLDKLPLKIFECILPVIFEDEYLAVINKPAGIPVSGNRFKTVQNAIPYNIKTSSQTDFLQLPRPIHRLDAATSGLLVIAKTKSSLMKLGQVFEQRQVQKTYQAVVGGKINESGEILTKIDEKPAKTIFKRLSFINNPKNNGFSLVELQPHTGRTHQLRRHLQQIGFPILGDKLYGNPDKNLRGKGLFLCATALQFTHPISHEALHFNIDPPNKFSRFLEYQRRLGEFL